MDFSGDIGRSLLELLERAKDSAASPPPLARPRVEAHFGENARAAAVVSTEIPLAMIPDLQAAIDDYLGEGGRASELLGLGNTNTYRPLTLSQLLVPPMREEEEITIGPVSYKSVALSDTAVTCVERGVYLVRDGEGPSALLIAGPQHEYEKRLHLFAAAPERETAEAIINSIRRRMVQKSVFRGRSLSISTDCYGGMEITCVPIPEIGRDRIILPAGVVERVERQTIRFSQYRDKLLAAGRHLRRGILLYGQPGTGKTLTAMYLCSAMKERTVILITGRGLGSLESACDLARRLEPSVVVIEDVDLIAQERGSQQDPQPLLFELLNRMDGLAADCDVVFLLTTNRPEALEPALAARPGRIDLSIEIPLPDDPCRRRLFELYGAGLAIEEGAVESLIERTRGASGAFIRELLRRAALFAADHPGKIRVTAAHLDEALRELTLSSKLSRRLLGFSAGADEP